MHIDSREDDDSVPELADEGVLGEDEPAVAHLARLDRGIARAGNGAWKKFPGELFSNAKSAPGNNC
jgi:hypothetical protein